MPLDEILENNRLFTKGRPPRPLPPPARMSLTVLACFDPRLDDLLLPALGLVPDRVFLFRAGGAYVAPESATLRSLMVGVLLLESTELVVLGHSSCRLAQFQTNAFIDAFIARGVRRDAFGSNDLREWAGAIPSPRRGVELSVATILSEPTRPPDLTVSGVLLDDTTGALETVVEPGGHLEAFAAGPPAPDPDPSKPRATRTPEPRREIPEKRPPPLPEASVEDPLVEAVEDLAAIIGSSTKWRYEAGRLRQQLEAARNPAAKVRLLSDFVKRAGSDSADIVKAFERLTKLAGHSDGSGTLPDLLQRLVKKL